jgi:hypothetical protein
MDVARECKKGDSHYHRQDKVPESQESGQGTLFE